MRQIILFSLVTIFFLSGCGTQKETIKKYYVIESLNDSTIAMTDSLPTMDAWCEVAEVEVYPAFDTRRIVLRDESHQVRYFGNHEWAVSPADFLTPIIIDFLAGYKVFARVDDRFWERNPDYSFQTTVFNLEVVSTKRKTFEAHLKLKFDLIDVSTDAILLTHNADRKSELKERDLNLLAAEISQIFIDELSSFSIQIEKNLSK
ncbi:ABC-type transport auxiliary lipoprotein family protein [Marinilabilia sp.]|uniref:ABC-type transport auxiliary lipoprotein family protein n=1 Tax=Marinilabilia sp. TaxID=2021252 RepID=UPI0025BCCF38|nr:ABC-type transport auxiliary lipoprotein family protein [Marinilabilia sp.]